MKLTKEERAKVVGCCNEQLITDYNYDYRTEYPIEWFKRQFSFIPDSAVQSQLGAAFYEARFMYAFMSVLNLKLDKTKGIIKYQIIQYASICEALLNYTIDAYYKEEFGTKYASQVLTKVSQATSSLTQITYDGTPVYLCKYKNEKAPVTWTSTPTKTEFAVEKGIISEATKDKFCTLYDLRNNAHILKAASANYSPLKKEAQEGYELTFQFINEVRNFFAAHPLCVES